MVDYSKWNHIEISDDEDDTHPNIDTPSLFRWRHKARVERMEESEKERKKFEKEKKEYEAKVTNLKSKLNDKTGEDKDSMRAALSQLELEGETIREKQKELEKKEKAQPWNVDTIGKDGFSKTIINQPKKPVEEDLTEEQVEERFKKFIKENKKKIEHYGMLQKYEDSRIYMMENSHLACEDTANHMVIWCLNLMMEGKEKLMHHVAHQTICIQFILELAKQLERDPRSCVSAFFHRIAKAEPEYKRSFEEELEAFKKRITKRAEEKLQEAYEEAKEEERQARLGPGGLDPLEVLETLPDELKKCFETQDLGMLKEVIVKMDPAEASKYMKQCVDSGLWVPDANKAELQEDGLSNKKEDEEDDEKEEKIYEAPDSC